MKKGQIITYPVRSGGRVEARVLSSGPRVTRVEAMFFINPEGKRLPGYLGYRYAAATESFSEGAKS